MDDLKFFRGGTTAMLFGLVFFGLVWLIAC